MKKVVTLTLVLFICFISVVPALGANGFEEEYYRVVDKPLILDNTDRETLLAKLDEISVRQSLEVVVMITKSLDGEEISAYADDAYDERSYGMAKTKTVLCSLLIWNQEAGI